MPFYHIPPHYWRARLQSPYGLLTTRAIHPASSRLAALSSIVQPAVPPLFGAARKARIWTAIDSRSHAAVDGILCNETYRSICEII
jgi:hypothetical protein